MRTSAQDRAYTTIGQPRISGRLAVASHAVIQGLSNFSADMKVLFRRWNDGPVLRQKQVDGFQMLVRAEEEVGRNIYYKGVYETEETEFFRSRVGKSSVCFDVGANIGYFSLLFASLCPQGSVHSFEPVPLNYHTLCTNKVLNGFTNITANLCAVGDRETKVDFIISKDSALSSLLDTGRGPVAERVLTTMTTLDAYCEKHDVAHVDVLKVDVEGAECAVLSGARQLFSDQARKPHLVMLEIFEPMLRKYGESALAVLRQMRAYEYGPFVLDAGRRIEFEDQMLDGFYNVFFECREGSRGGHDAGGH